MAWAKDLAWWWVAEGRNCSGIDGGSGERMEALIYPHHACYSEDTILVCLHFQISYIKQQDLCSRWLVCVVYLNWLCTFLHQCISSLVRNVFSLSFLVALFKLPVTCWVLLTLEKIPGADFTGEEGLGGVLLLYTHRTSGCKSSSATQSGWWLWGRPSNPSRVILIQHVRSEWALSWTGIIGKTGKN